MKDQMQSSIVSYSITSDFDCIETELSLYLLTELVDIFVQVAPRCMSQPRQLLSIRPLLELFVSIDRSDDLICFIVSVGHRIEFVGDQQSSK